MSEEVSTETRKDDESPVVDGVAAALRGVKWPDGEPYIHMAHVHIRTLAEAAAKAALEALGPDDISDGYHTFTELYAHRRALTAALLSLMPMTSWRSRLHHDGTMFEGMFIVGVDLHGIGQVSYHYDLEHWNEFARVTERDRAPEFDGHTPDDVVARLIQWAGGRSR